MNRTLVYLAAALGLLLFSGCGEVPGGGVVASSAPPKPAAPAPADQNLKPAPSPLTPSKLPAATAAPESTTDGQQPAEQPAVGQPNNVAPPASALTVGLLPPGASTAPPTATQPGVVPVAPPAKSSEGLFNSLFGNTPPVKTSPPADSANAPNAPPADNSLPISLSNVSVARVTKEKIHFELSYAFKSPLKLSHWYTVVVQEQPDPDTKTNILPGNKKFQGFGLHPQGTLTGDLIQAGRNPTFQVSVFEGPSPDAKGQLASNVVEVEVRRDLPQGGRSELRRPAVPGVGAQGKGYGAGLVTTPVSAYFAAKELIVFTAQIPKAMQLFNALNNRNPKSQEEFMEKIIKDNAITLPELPAGERYVYDPQAGQLMVEHPSK